MRVIIIGKGKGWEDAPADGYTWGVNDLCCRRDVRVVFDMHKRSDTSVSKAIEEYAVKNHIPLISLTARADIPTALEFPLESMHTEYFTNSIAYMIAYAVHKSATEIDLYGCFMGNRTEYAYQKPCIEYWIGYARGLGVVVRTHTPTALMRIEDGLVYGYSKRQEKF